MCPSDCKLLSMVQRGCKSCQNALLLPLTSQLEICEHTRSVSVCMRFHYVKAPRTVGCPVDIVVEIEPRAVINQFLPNICCLGALKTR